MFTIKREDKWAFLRNKILSQLASCLWGTHVLVRRWCTWPGCICRIVPHAADMWDVSHSTLILAKILCVAHPYRKTKSFFSECVHLGNDARAYLEQEPNLCIFGNSTQSQTLRFAMQHASRLTSVFLPWACRQHRSSVPEQPRSVSLAEKTLGPAHIVGSGPSRSIQPLLRTHPQKQLP
jgi:hypothetical protein